MSIETMKKVKQELEHIKQYGYATDIDHAIKTLGQAIVDAQKPEPLTWAETNDMVCALLRQAHDVLACASYPFKRPWVSLTELEIAHALEKANLPAIFSYRAAARAGIEAFKERNT